MSKDRMSLTLTNKKVIEAVRFVAKEEGITYAKVVTGRVLEQLKREGYKIGLKDVL